MNEFKFLLDTSTCIELLRGNVAVRQKCIEENQFCCISIITSIELMYGAYRAPAEYQERELQKARLLIDYYSVIGIDEIAEAFCKEKIRLEIAGLPIEDFDLLIGITAKEYGMSVITHNVKHFTRINGLTVLDWTELANDAGCADSLL